VPCTYPAGSFGELVGNLTGLLATPASNITPFTLEADTCVRDAAGQMLACQALIGAAEQLVAGY
jgi:hypothetical protein